MYIFSIDTGFPIRTRVFRVPGTVLIDLVRLAPCESICNRCLKRPVTNQSTIDARLESGPDSSCSTN